MNVESKYTIKVTDKVYYKTQCTIDEELLGTQNETKMKQLIIDYILAYKDQLGKERHLAEAFKQLNPDNYLISTISSSMLAWHKSVLSHLVGTVGLEEIEWWIHETHFGIMNYTVFINEIPHEIKTADDLYEILLE